MAVQMTIAFEQLLALVEQLRPEEQVFLIEHLQGQLKQKPLSISEKQTLFKSTIIHLEAWPQDFSLRREDWYGDDGRSSRR